MTISVLVADVLLVVYAVFVAGKTFSPDCLESTRVRSMVNLAILMLLASAVCVLSFFNADPDVFFPLIVITGWVVVVLANLAIWFAKSLLDKPAQPKLARFPVRTIIRHGIKPTENFILAIINKAMREN